MWREPIAVKVVTFWILYIPSTISIELFFRATQDVIVIINDIKFQFPFENIIINKRWLIAHDHSYCHSFPTFIVLCIEIVIEQSEEIKTWFINEKTVHILNVLWDILYKNIHLLKFFPVTTQRRRRVVMIKMFCT